MGLGFRVLLWSAMALGGQFLLCSGVGKSLRPGPAWHEHVGSTCGWRRGGGAGYQPSRPPRLPLLFRTEFMIHKKTQIFFSRLVQQLD